MVVLLTAANVADGVMLLPLVDAIPAVRGKVGAPRRKPDAVTADKAYHSADRVGRLYDRGIEPLLPKRGVPDTGPSLGHQRWMVERTISWLHQNRRLRIRYERRPDIHQALLLIGCALICFRTIDPLFC